MPPKYSLTPEHNNQTTNAVLIAWPYPTSDWQANLEEAEKCYSDMLDAFSADYSVIVLLHPSIDVVSWLKRYKPKSTVCVINAIDYDDTWVRDYGPLNVESISATHTAKQQWMRFQFNGWGDKYPSAHDNNVTSALAVSLSRLLITSDYVLEGGALEVNHQRVLLANKTCLLNPSRNKNLTLSEHEYILSRVLNIRHFAWLDVAPLTGDDTDGHIDTIARFVSDNHVVYTQPNHAHPDNNTLIELESQLKALAGIYAWQLTGLPTPQVFSRIAPKVLLPATYTNFLIVKNTVFCPAYGVKSDMVAFNILKSVFSRYNLVSINCRALLEQCGSLHCATMQLTV